jgi:DNA mismatch endonuclease (patch repair protein)
MRANRKSDTRPELALRSALHSLGLRYRLGTPVRAQAVRVVPDVLFGRARVAVFLDGCFFHQCPDHGVQPRSNAAYWTPKLARNVERDRRVDAALRADGWTVIRIWEHEDPRTSAAKVASAVRDLSRRRQLTSTNRPRHAFSRATRS